jgi:hypothetical protein
VPRRAEAPPPPSRPARRRARAAALVLSLAALVGLGFAWRLELAPKPELGIDWGKVQAITSPQPGLAATPGGSELAVDVREPRPAERSEAPPIVFPNVPPQRQAPIAPPAPPLAAETPSGAAAVTAPQAQPESPKADTPRIAPAQPEPPAPVEPTTQLATAPAPMAPPAPPPAATQTAVPETATVAAPPPPDHEARIAELLAQARRLALAFALTTPPGQSAYDSYREVLTLDPGRREAFAGLDEIAAKYDDLAGLARQRDKPALVQLYESRAAQVRRDRTRLAAEAATPRKVGAR